MVHVPYKGSAPAVTDLLGNQIGIMFDNMPSAIQHVRSGKLVPIAVTTAKRSPELPNVPTIAEAGVAGYEATSWFGMFAPAGTPAPVLAKLNTALVKVLNQADVKKKINDQGAEAMSETPAQFAAFIQAESVKWGKVVKESGASLD
ncbi:Tripartite tricarboxylate transporter family receptor [compost metagenome]